MSWEDFLDQTCDIYHLNRGGRENLGCGLEGAYTFHYSANPDVAGVACHFHVTDPTRRQNEPNDDLIINTKLSLPKGTDIRILDKVVCKETGREYTVKSDPRPVHGHHVYVWVERERVQMPL